MRNVTGHGGEKSNPELRGGNCVRRRRVHDEAPVLRRGRQVNVVDADAGASDDLEAAAGGLEDVAGDFGATTDD